MAPSAISPTISSTDPQSLKHMHHHPQAQQTYSPPLIANENAFLGDIFSSDAVLAAAASPDTTTGKAPARAPISAGFFKLEPGTPLVYTYTYDEMKIRVEGEFIITDLIAGKTVTGAKGDVFFFPKGSEIKFETRIGAKGFFTGQRKEGTA